MSLKELLKNKKAKNLIITISEILFVAGIIFGILMFVQNKINKEADVTSGLNKNQSNEETTAQANNYSDKYTIEVNIKKNAVIIYQYSKDKKSKKPYKVFRCTIGSSVKKGKYKTSSNYSWIKTNGYWHKYNTMYDEGAYFQSANYTDHYDNTLQMNSYKKIGSKQKAGKCILLSAKDAYFIKTKCSNNTAVEIKKGKSSDVLPLAFEQQINPQGKCKWEPTDPSKNNPYLKKGNGKIVSGLSTVYIEKGHKVNYLNNLIALDEDGTDVTSKLTYKKFSSDELGKKTVTFTMKTKSGKKITLKQKYVVVDTTPPKVSCSKSLFTYTVDSLAQKDLNTTKTVKAIISMVKQASSCNEAGATITVSTVEPEQLDEGKFPVVIKAKDSSGNVGNLTVMCEIKAKKSQKVKKFEPKTTAKAKKKKKNKKKETEKETTKKPTETTKQPAEIEQEPTVVNE